MAPSSATGAPPDDRQPEYVPPETLDGGAFRRLLAGAAQWLDRNATAVNELNVFPVPDGDTGTNMLLTIRAALDAASKVKGGHAQSAAQVMRAAAQGAVMGARGNSGVILSQIVSGLARSLGDATTCDGAALAHALMEGASTAYRAVTRPVEGTILTVARAAGESAASLLDRSSGNVALVEVFEHALSAARAAVERTPEQLPVLRQAGVVDAGGEGYRVILEGMALTYRGEALPEAPDTPVVQAEALGALALRDQRTADLSAIASEEWGYCTQFVIRGEALDLETVRRELQALADSALVVGDVSMIRVHGHTEDPGQLLSYAIRLGRLQRISIEDMDAQHDAWLRTQVGEREAEAGEGGEEDLRAPELRAPVEAVASIAVAPGSGLAAVFRDVGVGEVVPGGQTMNPSAQDLLEAARRTRARTVIVLPNNGNVIMTARQAASLSEEPKLLVVPTRTVPQGLAAQLAFDATADLQQVVAAMEEAAERVRTVEVTRATRTVVINGVSVHEGDALGLLDDTVVSSAATALEAAVKALEAAGASSAELITIYRGQDVTANAGESFAQALRERFPHAEVELLEGGQPHYDYVISVE